MARHNPATPENKRAHPAASAAVQLQAMAALQDRAAMARRECPLAEKVRPVLTVQGREAIPKMVPKTITKAACKANPAAIPEASADEAVRARLVPAVQVVPAVREVQTMRAL